MVSRGRVGTALRRPVPWLPAVAVAAAAVVAAAALAASLPQHDAAAPEAAAACGAVQAPADPACTAGPPAAAPSGGGGGGHPDGTPGRQERLLPEPVAPYASSRSADRPNPSNTTIAASSPPVAGEPLVVVVTTTLPLTAAVMRGNGSIGEIEFPDGHTDEADTSVHVLFGGDVTVLSSDPALGAPSYGEAGGNSYTEIGGTLAATPGQEYRFEFTVLPAGEGVTVIDAAGFLRGAARLVLDVAPAAGRNAQGNQQSAAAPDPPERAGLRGGEPPSGPSLDDAIRAALAAPRAGAPVPAPAGADSGIPAGSLAGRGGPGPSGHPRAALPGPEPAPGGHGSRSDAADAGAGDLVLYGEIRMELPYSDLRGPAHGLFVCATDYNIVDASETLLNYTDGTAACTFANEHGWYVLGPLDGTDPDGDGTGPDLSIDVLSAGDGMSVRDSARLLYYEASASYLPDREAGNARLDMDVVSDAMNGAARIVDAISDTKAYFKEDLGAEIPPVTVFWHYGSRVADAWLEHADSGDAFYVALDSEIFLGGLDTSATYDESESRYTIQHEYGHHVHSRLGGPSEGCTHRFDQKISPGCAFGEGLAYFVPHMVDDAPLLREYEHVYVDMERELHIGAYEPFIFNYDNSTDKQTEIQVAGALWDVYDEHVDETHDRKRSRTGGQTVPESGILDDLHMGADEIIQIVQDGPQNAEQFYVRWERQAGLGSMENIMDLHRMPFNATGDLPVFAPIPPVTVSHTGEAAVPVSATIPGGANVSLDVRQGFENEYDLYYVGAAMDDNGDGTGTLILNPARADVGENFVVVRANSSGNIELARVDVTVTEPPKWAPVQLNDTFDKGLVDWTRQVGSGASDTWGISWFGDTPDYHLTFRSENPRYVYSTPIDMTAHSSATLEFFRDAPLLEAGSYLRVYAFNSTGEFEQIEEWGADAATGGYEAETIVLPADLMVEDFTIMFVAKGLPADPLYQFSVDVDDVVITGTRGGNPAIEAPGDVRAEAASPGSTTIADLGAPTTDPQTGLAITREPQLQSFPLGTTEVTWTATDTTTGESDSDTQRVTVFDTTPPSVTPPANYAVRAGGENVFLSANDYCAASATDAVSDVIKLNNAPLYFPVGNTTTVTWLALDRSGNPVTAEQNVTVVRSDDPHVPVHAVLAWADPYAPREPGSAMMIHVNFSHPVALTAAMSGGAPGSLEPYLEMEGGGIAIYESGNGTDSLTFSYTVQQGETAPDYAGTDALGGLCTIRSAADNRGANLELPDPGHPGFPGLPRVLDVSSNATAGVYGEGQTIGIQVGFSEPVVVSGSPELLLDAGAPGAAATYAGGSGTSLAFEYTVRAGDAAADLDYPGTGALVLGGGSISSPHGTAADLELPDPAAEPGLLAGPGKIAVATVPRVLEVSSDAAAGLYGEGRTIGIRVGFSEPVAVSGSPQLLLAAGAPGASAAYANGSGTSSLAFVYTVRPGDAAADLDYPGTGALVLGGGSISSPHGTAADLELPDPAAEPGLLAGPGKIAVATVPRVLEVSSDAAAGLYGEGRTIGIRVGFSEPVAVSGSPQLLLAAGAPGASAAYANGSGTSSLAFVYTVRPGDAAADLDYSGTGALVLNGGSVSSPHGTAADLELPDPAAEPGLLAGPGKIAVATVPRVLEVSSDAAAGLYGEGRTIGIRVGFSEPVAVSGSPQLLLAAGAPGASAAYATGSGTSSLAFVYTVRPGDAAADLDYSGTGALVLNGGSVSSPHGTAADLELPDPAAEPGLLAGPGKIAVATVPRVLEVSSDAAAGLYGEGRTIGIRVGFSEPVAVSGSPQLLLAAGAPGASAAYATGSGTSSLAFVYTVRPGDAAADLDYSGTAALVLNGGSISSPHGTAADLELPDPAAEPGLLAGPGEITVGTKPFVPVGVFAGGPGDPSAAAARLGASAFNALSAERGYPFLVAVSEYGLPAGASGAAAAAALRDAHDNGRGPALYVGPASDGALHGMAGHAAADGITLVSHSSAARSLAVEGDGIYRLEPGAAHLARALALEIARGGFGAVVPVVQAGLHGPGYGLLESLESDLEALGIPVGEPVAFAGGGGGAAAAPIVDAVAAAAGSGTARSVAVVYMGSDAELVAMAGGVPADGPVRERSAWFAAGGAGAGAGSGVAASPAVLADAAAIQLARDTRLSAVQFAVERNSITDYIDRIAAPRGPATSATPAYAAYEAVRVLGGALVPAGGDPTLAGGNIAGAAALDGGPLGRTGMDGSGDLRFPVTYGAWSVSGTAAEWERAPELLRGLDACGIDLEKPALAIPNLSAGSTSRPVRQTVANIGTGPMPAVSVSATDWTQFRDGAPIPGQLPFSYTEMAVGLDGASPRRADSTPLAAGTEIPGGTPPGGSVDVDFRINLGELEVLRADSISQTVTFVANCS